MTTILNLVEIACASLSETQAKDFLKILGRIAVESLELVDSPGFDGFTEEEHQQLFEEIKEARAHVKRNGMI